MKRTGLVLIAALCTALWAPPLTSAATPGKIVFASDRDGDDEIFVMNADGSGQTQLSFNAADDQDPFWSPNGKQIGFFSDRAGGAPNELFIMNADGSSPRQLTFGTMGNYSGDWSPDGRQIVFGRSDPGTDNGQLIDVATGAIRPLTSFTTGNGPYGWHFSPNGTQVIFTNDGPAGPDPLAVIPSAGGAVTNITSISGYAPDFTADGKRIVFYSQQAPDGGVDNEIVSAAVNGTDLRQLTVNSVGGNNDSAPSPSRDGLNRIVFRSTRDGDQELFVMNADGSGQTQITFNTSTDKGPDWQPNVKCGKGVATIVGTSASETLTGGPGPDIISGQGGKDKIKGLGGKDVICGDAGKDNLNGGNGKDQLFGGKGKDKTVGGKGKDKCVGGGGDDSGKGCEKEKSL